MKSRHARAAATSTSAVAPASRAGLHRLARAQQRLGRNARPVGALAADQLPLDHGDAQPAGRRAPRRSARRGAAAENDHVVVVARAHRMRSSVGDEWARGRRAPRRRVAPVDARVRRPGPRVPTRWTPRARTGRRTPRRVAAHRNRWRSAMASTDASSETTSATQGAPGVDMALEVVTLPVSDVDRAKELLRAPRLAARTSTWSSATTSARCSSRRPTRSARSTSARAARWREPGRCTG